MGSQLPYLELELGGLCRKEFRKGLSDGSYIELELGDLCRGGVHMRGSQMQLH